MIGKERMEAYNAALKHRALSADEWAEVDEYVKSQPPEYLKTLEKEYPMIAVKYKPRDAGYEIFLQITAKTLNENDRFKDAGLMARVERAECGDGSGLCLCVCRYGITTGVISAMEDYMNFCAQNGTGTIDTFVRALMEQILRN